MSRVCTTIPTLTSTRLVPTDSLSVSYRSVYVTVPPVVNRVPYLTCSTSVIRGTPLRTTCINYSATRVVSTPGRTTTSRIPVTVTVHGYDTQVTMYYGTSCSIRTTATPSPTTPSSTSPSPTISYQYTRSIVYPSSSIDPTDTMIPDQTPTPTATRLPSKSKPIGLIIGGVIGGLAVAALLGFLIFQILFRRKPRNRGGVQQFMRTEDERRPLYTQTTASSQHPSFGGPSTGLDDFAGGYIPMTTTRYTATGEAIFAVPSPIPTINTSSSFQQYDQLINPSFTAPVESAYAGTYPTGMYRGFAEPWDSTRF